ncbi:MAG: glycine--tRNA ligase subunit beta [Aquificaceae bacterium]|nr:glycine--tRNA ligase subunit beta [Aquificaceae bacterium]
MKDLLIEIGTEELPAGVINGLLEYIKEKLSGILLREDIKTYSTPRRLAFFVKDFENKSPEKEELLWGPPLKVAYEEGKPTKALIAFLERHSARLEDVCHLQRGEGNYVAIKRLIKEESPLERLLKSFEEILQSAHAPKTMRWDSSNLRFSRPIRWICALYGTEILPLCFGSVRAGRITYGHRILSPTAIELKGPEDYERTLRESYVIADYKERLGMVLAFLQDEAYALGGKPLYPEGLEEEVTNLVEFPFAVVGKFEEKYLELPDRVIMTVLAHHQRFFCVEKEGRLLPHFIAISNNYPRDGVIVKGYEKVIKARLEDTLFFYREDLKRPLEDLVPALSEVIFHPKAGSMWEKVRRVVSFSLKLADLLGLEEGKKQKIERAAYLCKADLLTHMVREMSELQGYMGYVYALKQGEEPDVALALYEHYLPVRTSDPLPSNHISAVLSIADRLDSLQTLMAVGEAPTGSSDPYGMRRLAHGLFSILEFFEWDIDLREILDDHPQELEEFLKTRLEAYLNPYGYDLARAVLEVKSPMKPYEVIIAVKRLALMKEEEEFKNIVEAYRRVVKILPAGWEDDMLDEGLLREEEEKNLWRALESLEVSSQEPSRLLALKEPIDLFFDHVLVMDPDEKIRRNRLAILLRIKRLFNRFADFSKIVV